MYVKRTHHKTQLKKNKRLIKYIKSLHKRSEERTYMYSFSIKSHVYIKHL